jgi:3-hydroxyisobutyrate dehydrogenase-like beta-hydroxyacid dehydrogenase
MGIVAAATMVNGGHEVYWASAGRSQPTTERARQAGLKDIGTAREMAQHADVIVSICPPQYADATAGTLMEGGFRGLFLDANAISPQRARAMAQRVTAAGIRFVDGGIIGPAVMKQESVWLYLSGEEAECIAELFQAGPMIPEIMGREPGEASALKMCFAAYNKGRAALLTSVVAAAHEFGVFPLMQEQWTRRDGPFAGQAETFITSMAGRAWRFEAEMREIASTFESIGLPGEFHEGAARLFAVLRDLKDDAQPPLEKVMSLALRKTTPAKS